MKPTLLLGLIAALAVLGILATINVEALIITLLFAVILCLAFYGIAILEQEEGE